MYWVEGYVCPPASPPDFLNLDLLKDPTARSSQPLQCLTKGLKVFDLSRAITGDYCGSVKFTHLIPASIA